MAASQPLTHCRIKCALADLPSSLLRNPASEMHAGKDLSLQKSKIRRNIFRLWRDRKCVTNLSRWVDRWTGTRRDLGFSCGFRQLDVYCWPGVPVQVTRCAPFRYRRVRRTSSGCSHVEPTGIFIAPFEQGEIGPDLFRAACYLGLKGSVSKRPALSRGSVAPLDQGEEP